jgi:hypothetical protein
VLRSHASDLVSEGHRFLQDVRLPFTGDELVLLLSASNTPLESRVKGLPAIAGIEGQKADFVDVELTVLFISIGR